MASKGTGQLERLKRRAEGREVREDHALILYASGKTYAEITLDLAEKFGTSRHSTSNTIDMVARAFRRHNVKPEDVDRARTRIAITLEEILRVWTPLALGHGLDADLQPRVPSDKAAKVVFDALDRYGAVTGAVKPPEKTTNITVINQVPPDADSKRAAALEELLRESRKLTVIDGELASAGTSLEANRDAGGGISQLMPSPVPTKKGQP